MLAMIKLHILANSLSEPLMSDKTFEDQLKELESLVVKLESGELGLEQAMATFEQGVTLTRNCQKALSEAEQKLNVLTSAPGDTPKG